MVSVTRNVKGGGIAFTVRQGGRGFPPPGGQALREVGGFPPPREKGMGGKGIREGDEIPGE